MLRLKIKPLFQKWAQYKIKSPIIKSHPSPSSSHPPPLSSLVAGNISLCCNSLKYKSYLLLPFLSLTKPYSSSLTNRFVVSADEKQTDLENFESNDYREELLLTSPGTLWMRIKMVFRVAHLLVIFLPVVVTSPIHLILKPKSKYITWWWSLLRFSFERAGACWIKFGQWASTRPDLFPSELCQQLSLLHSSCPSHRGSHSIKMISKELNKRMSDLFIYFDPVPMASGSIAQVHKAVLKNGRVVVVKVLHPKAYRTILSDFRILYSLVKFVSRFPTLKWLSLHEGVLEFGKSMVRQLDLRREAYNLVRFNENFKNSKTIQFPIPVYARRSVLIETFEPGEPISLSIKQKSSENKGIASMGFNAYLKMMLIDNFTHSDLHPGNILLRKSIDDKPQLVLLDVGLVTELSPRDKENFLSLFEAVVRGDGRLGAEMMVKYATDTQCQGPLLEDFKDDMERIFTAVQNKSLSSVKVGKVMNDVLNTVRKHHVKIESNFATLVMGTMVLEGLGKQLDPSLNLIKEAIPYFAKEELKHRFSISNLLDKFRTKQ